MRAVFLFTNERGCLEERVKNKEDSDDHFLGSFRLNKYGVESDYLELEKKFSFRIARFLRNHLSLHFIHIPLLPFISKYDVVVTSTGIGTLFFKTIFFLRPKWVMYDYNISGQLISNKTWKGKIFRWLMGKVDGFITLSEEEAETMRKLYPKKSDKILFLPFASDSDYYKPVSVEEEDFLLSVGRDPGRDWKTLLRALDGTGIKCKVTAKENQINSAGHVPAEISRHTFSSAELLEEYSKSKIVVLPLNPIHANDSMGCSTLIQAMSMGKAIIATDTVTMRNYVTDGVNGRLVPQSDSEALRMVIKELLEDDEQRKMLGKNAREFVIKKCNPEKFAKELADFLQNCISACHHIA